MKGIILAGGRGTRLFPLTMAVSKQLLPIYDKPMIYYPLSIHLLAGIRDILIISTPEDLPSFQRLMGDGKQWGLRLSYAEQIQPRGLADVFIIGRDFIDKEKVCLILGDNIIYGSGLPDMLAEAIQWETGALIFAYPVHDPERYGVVTFNEHGKVLSLEEKPRRPRSNFAVPGLYFYDNEVVEFARTLKPSKRGELEITDLNRIYLRRGRLSVRPFSRGIAWLDAGTHEALLQASQFVQTVQERQGLMISSPEEIAYRRRYIDKRQLIKLADQYNNNPYGKYLKSLSDEE